MHAHDRNKPTHVTRGNVFDDIFPPEKAPAIKLKAELHDVILKYAKQYPPQGLELILDVPQPRVSELLRGKIAHTSIEKLLEYADKLGIVPEAKFRQKHKPAHHKEAMAMAGHY